MKSDQSKSIPSMPKETARAANAIFSRSNSYIVIGEYLETLLEDIQLEGSSQRESLAKTEGAIGALITFFQFIEGLTDVQAVDAVRTRTDWKFALHLSLVPARFHEYVFCEFRQRILTDSASQYEFQRLLDQLITLIPSLCSSFQHLNSREVVAFVCSVNQLDHAQQTMNQVLETLAVQFPDWLRKMALPHWYGRYNRAVPRPEVALLLGQKRFLMEEIGADIHHLLKKIHQSDLPELRELYEVKALDRVWSQQFKALNLQPGNWPENFKGCNTCVYQGMARRQ
jgi:transposase